jgi:hypothetical protein
MTLHWTLAKRLALGALLLASTVRLFSTGTPFGALLRLSGELLMLFMTLWAPGYALLTRSFRYALSEAEAHLLAMPLTIALYGTLFALLYATSAPVPVYVLLYLGCFGAACVVLGRRLRAGHAIHLPRAHALAFLLALSAACFICTSLEGRSPWGAMTWQIPATRATHSLTEDNNLPWASARVFIEGGEPWAWRDGYWNWTMGDRPALLAALTAAYAKSFLAYRRLRFFDYTLIGIVLNVLYVVPCAYLARLVIRSERLALWAVLSLALMPYFFVNVYYTWPKLLGVYFTMTALAFFLKRPSEDPWAWPQPRAAAVLGALLSLGAQGHGGAALSAPFVVIAVALFAAKRPLRRLVPAGAALIASFVLVMVPWLAYIAAHPDIQTNNLAYHYRPQLDRPGHVMSWSQWWTEYPLEKQLSIRWANILSVFESSEFVPTLKAYATEPLQPFYAGRWVKEFFHPVSQVDELRIMLGAGAIALAVTLLAHRRLRGKREPARLERPLDAPLLAALMVLSLLSYLGNVFMKWESIVPHALPIAEVACLCLTLALLILGVSRVLAYVLLWSVLARFAHFVILNTVPAHLFGSYGVYLLTSLALLPWLIGAPYGSDRLKSSTTKEDENVDRSLIKLDVATLRDEQEKLIA